ncbi:MAG: carbohydrate ABC transporter permease [Firmicutes bacterium]|nr:carbohydrate ABC transporter permease [Bacillota bacterium]
MQRLRLVDYIQILAMLLLCLIMAFPMVWMVYSAMKPNRLIFTKPWALPERVTVEPLVKAWQAGQLGGYFKNSIIVTTSTVLGILLISSLAAFALARLKFQGRNLLFGVFLAGLIIPAQTYVIPLFTLLRELGLIDRYIGLILPYIALGLPMAIFILQAFLSTLPTELDDAAAIDGCGLLATFLLVTMPISKPALATVAILSTINAWNEFLFAMLFIRNPAMRTLPIGLYVFYGHYDIDYQMLFGGLTVATIPLLIFYVFFHRFIIEGLTAGALKG